MSPPLPRGAARKIPPSKFSDCRASDEISIGSIRYRRFHSKDSVDTCINLYISNCTFMRRI